MKISLSKKQETRTKAEVIAEIRSNDPQNAIGKSDNQLKKMKLADLDALLAEMDAPDEEKVLKSERKLVSRDFAGNALTTSAHKINSVLSDSAAMTVAEVQNAVAAAYDGLELKKARVYNHFRFLSETHHKHGGVAVLADKKVRLMTPEELEARDDDRKEKSA